MNEALQSIESLRLSLYKLVEEFDGDLLHPAVVAASERLDAEVSNWQQAQRRRVLPLCVAAI